MPVHKFDIPRLENHLNRRELIALATAAGIFGASVAKSTHAQTPSVVGPLTESPTLTAAVDTGSLPPVAERVPQNPLVVMPYESTGQYGGRWRTAIVGGLDTTWLARTVAYDNLVRWSADWSTVEPNIAESWEINELGTAYTFHLRSGHKWSDGQPFTADDIIFYGTDVYRNPDLTSSLGANPWTVEKVDDATFTITFEKPNGLFLKQLATTDGGIWTRYPKHYLMQFHAAYNTENLDQLVQEAELENWVQLFQSKASAVTGTSGDALWQNIDLPRLHAWKIKQPFVDGSRVTVDRNPFYFKVDPSGNQLPYIDEVDFSGVQDNEVLLLQALSGELDMHVRHINTNANKPVLAEAAADGEFQLFDTIPGTMNTVTIGFNLTHLDPTMRAIFQNKDFRVGMSHAINRHEVIDTVYVSQGEPWQCAPRPESPYYHEDLAKQFTEFDVDLANEFLDKVLPNKDGSGWRSKPDGSEFIPIVEVAANGTVAPVDEMTLVVGYWQAVGINAQLRTVDRALLSEHKASNNFDVTVWQGDGGLSDALLNMTCYAPTLYQFAPAWAIWFNQPADPTAAAEEPPAEVKGQLDLITKLGETADTGAQDALMTQILDIARDQFYCLGINLPASGYGIVKNNFKNVRAPMIDAFLYPTPGPTNPEQFYIEG